MVNKRAQINQDKHRTIHLLIEDCKDNKGKKISVFTLRL